MSTRDVPGVPRTIDGRAIGRWTTEEERNEEPADKNEKKAFSKDPLARPGNGNAANLGKYNGNPPNLSRKFRLGIRNLMTQPEIEEILRARIVGELEGTMRVKILPTILKIAAGQSFNAAGPKTRIDSMGGPAIHVHLNAMTDPQLKAYYERGILPDSMTKLLEMRKSSERHEPAGTYEDD